MYKAIYRAR